MKRVVFMDYVILLEVFFQNYFFKWDGELLLLIKSERAQYPFALVCISSGFLVQADFYPEGAILLENCENHRGQRWTVLLEPHDLVVLNDCGEFV